LRQVASVYDLLIKKKELDSNGIYLSKVAVAQAIDNALKDMARMSDFHLPVGKTPDRHKYAGFVAKWVAKCRPIQMDNNTQINSQRLWANATFAMFVMASFLDMESIDYKLSEYLKYWFQFRDERGETLSLIAYCWEEIGSAPVASSTSKS